MGAREDEHVKHDIDDAKDLQRSGEAFSGGVGRWRWTVALDGALDGGVEGRKSEPMRR